MAEMGRVGVGFDYRDDPSTGIITDSFQTAVDCTELTIQIPFDGPYGTKSEKMACPLSALIEARFTDFSQEGKDYPDVSVLDKKFVSQGLVGDITGVYSCC